MRRPDWLRRPDWTGRTQTARETANQARNLWYGALITGGVSGAITFGVAADLYIAHRRAVRARRLTPKGTPSP